MNISRSLPEPKDLSSSQEPLSSRPEIVTEGGHAFMVPAEGSLGLLALGYVGLMLWREARRNAAQAKG